MIQAYFDQIKTLIDKYATTPFVLDAEVNFEIRPGEQGYLTGSITFEDGSVLYFREFLDGVGETVDRNPAQGGVRPRTSICSGVGEG